MARADRLRMIRKIEELRGSRVICYLTSDRPNADAQMQKDVMPLLFDHLRAGRQSGRIDLFLYTTGGDTLAAFGIGRLLREFCAHLGVIAPLRCHSAGTLLALGANDVLMTRGATLSPIDPSITSPLNPAVEVAPGQRQLLPLSVESVACYRDLVVQDWGLQGEQALEAAFRVLAERVHPIALGDVFRARQQIEHLARKLLSSHRSDAGNMQRIVTTLTRGLGSHDYLISRTEARELLGGQVAADDEALEGLAWDLFKDFSAEMELREAFDPTMILHATRAAGHAGPIRVTQRLAVLESAVGADVAEREMILTEVGGQAPPGTPPQLAVAMSQGKGLSTEVIRAGWTHYEP